MPYDVRVSVDAPKETRWAALTAPETIREWFGWDYDGIDDEIRMIFVDEAKPEPPDRIGFGDGSYLEVTDDGVRAVQPAGQEPEGGYDAIGEGWLAFFEQLRYLLERAPAGRRRTIYLTGQFDADEMTGLLDTLGARWHHSPYQTMNVTPEGHLVGLNGTAVTVSTYGLNDAAFDTVHAAWVQRWSNVTDGEITVAKS